MPFSKTRFPVACLRALTELLVLVSALCVGGGVFLLAVMALPDEGGRAGYAVLSVDASYSDGEIATRVSDAANTAISAGYSAESTQWVYFNDFGTMLRLSLDEYDERLDASVIRDPRDDGYATRLRAFFVRDGRRFFFIPFERPALLDELKTRFLRQSHSGNWELESALTETLVGLPFSLEWLGADRAPLWLYVGLADAVCVFAVLLSRVALLVGRRFPAPLGGAPFTAQAAAFLAVGLVGATAFTTVRVVPLLEEAARLYHAPESFTCEPIEASEYQAHLDFQISFMGRSLYPLNTTPYLRYTRAENGFIVETPFPADAMTLDAPPFPLKKLMDFLTGVN
ncbi:MAG: hypothetical protein LBS86_01675 [Treponema sp.]|jgi:hypothetical protein|nr:hypothetical protein [Treponema sp.]